MLSEEHFSGLIYGGRESVVIWQLYEFHTIPNTSKDHKDYTLYHLRPILSDTHQVT